MSSLFKGNGVSAGIGIGKAFVISQYEFNVPQNFIDDAEKELEKLSRAVKTIVDDLENASDEQGDILEAYIMLLKDPNVTEEVRRFITVEKRNAAFAVEKGLSMVADVFLAMQDDYMSERSGDINDIKTRLLIELLNIPKHDVKNLSPGSNIVASDLSLSDMLSIDFEKVNGIVTEIGGKNSHVSIIARNFSIPLAVGVNDIVKEVLPDMDVIVDGRCGDVVLCPNSDQVMWYAQEQTRFFKQKSSLECFRDKPSITKDGVELDIMANVGSYGDVECAIDCMAGGIGLLRSEFLFSDVHGFRSEEKQFEMYRGILVKMSGAPVTIRLFDFGGDKSLKGITIEGEENPALGCRGVRLALRNRDILKTQIKALLRASVYGPLHIMIPMVSSVNEVGMVRKVICEVKRDLKDICGSFEKNIKVGVMIEVPSAAIMCDKIACDCDFFSIGTNDLVQYVTASDRNNGYVSSLYSHYEPAVLRLINQVAIIASEHKIPCSVCGEAAADPVMLPLFIGMGIRKMSIAPNLILKFRKQLSRISEKNSRKLVNAVLNLSTAEQVSEYLKHYLKRVGASSRTFSLR